MYFKSNAKINLSLNVIEKRQDGYHNIDTIILPIDLSDVIAVNKLSNKKENKILFDDEERNFPNNICGKVVSLFNTKYSIDRKFEFAIYKKIPLEAGLGGGSSNAASIYKFYNKKFNLNLSNEQAINDLAPIGSDIPFFIFNRPCRVRGLGEIIEPIEIKNKYYCVIVKPRQGLSTKEIFQSIDRNSFNKVDIDSVVDALKNGDDEKLKLVIGNCLEEPAIKLCPKIKEIKEYLLNNGFPITLMTGSGSAVFSLSTDKHKIKNVVSELKRLNYTAFYTKIISEA